MIEVSLNVYYSLVLLFGAIAVMLIGLGLCDVVTPKLLWSGLIFAVLTLVIHFITPTEERMMTRDYEKILASRPECAVVIDKNIDSASIECLREYKAYLEDSIAIAELYYKHFSRLKSEIHR